jgi:hypothetical protein
MLNKIFTSKLFVWMYSRMDQKSVDEFVSSVIHKRLVDSLKGITFTPQMSSIDSVVEEHRKKLTVEQARSIARQVGEGYDVIKLVKEVHND